jgi:hypothetical protein
MTSKSPTKSAYPAIEREQIQHKLIKYFDIFYKDVPYFIPFIDFLVEGLLREPVKYSNKIKELKDKRYDDLFKYYIRQGPEFLTSTLNNGKNSKNILDHIIDYCIYKISTNKVLEVHKFIIVADGTRLSQAPINFKYMESNGCDKHNTKNKNIIYFDNKCLVISNEINSLYAKKDHEIYKRLVKSTKDSKTLQIKIKQQLLNENPELYYKTIYSSFDINDLTIRIIGTSVVGIGYSLHDNLLKVLLVSLDDNFLNENGRAYIYDLFMLGRNHPYYSETESINRIIACRKKRPYTDPKIQELSVLVCDYIAKNKIHEYISDLFY